jgi:hypothetical protein
MPRKALPAGEAYLNQRYVIYRSNAKARGLRFDLTKEDFKQIVLKPCHFCGFFPKTRQFKSSIKTSVPCNGVDRLHNSRGYSIKNAVPCCKVCNQVKNYLSLREFRQLVKKLYKRIDLW